MSMAMHMPKYSQIEYFDQLKSTGMNEKQAKVVLDLVNASAEVNFSDLVTKDYLNVRLNELELRLSDRMSQFELKLSRRFNALLITVVFSILAPLIFHHFGLI